MSTPPSSAARPTLRLVGILMLIAAVGLGSAQFYGYLGTRTTMADTPIKTAPAKIDGDRAYGYLKAICKIGPRPAGTAANTKQRQMVGPIIFSRLFRRRNALRQLLVREIRQQPTSAKKGPTPFAA